MKTEEQTRTYKIPVMCYNCGHRYDLEVPKGKEVTKGRDDTCLFIRNGGLGCDDIVKCPNCECFRVVRNFE